MTAVAVGGAWLALVPVWVVGRHLLSRIVVGMLVGGWKMLVFSYRLSSSWSWWIVQEGAMQCRLVIWQYKFRIQLSNLTYVVLDAFFEILLQFTNVEAVA